MHKETKYFVTFWMPGIIVGECWTHEVKSADPTAVEWPENAYAFTLHEREDVVDGDTRYEGKAKQLGPMYYHPDSKIETLEEVKQHHATDTILVRNMEINRWDRVIWSRWGSWPQPFKEGKQVILRA